MKMWPFTSKEKDVENTKEPILRLITKRSCVCGCNEWCQGRSFADLIHCADCGAVHYLNVNKPMANFE